MAKPDVHVMFLLIPLRRGRVKGAKINVMAGLSQPIHAFGITGESKAWMPGTRPGMTDQEALTAVTSTSTLNSGRVKPETITSVEAKALPET
jgi:hypothetical protein